MIRRVALVTGAGGGIGRAAALSFAQAGYAVTVADVKEQGGHETVEMIKTQLHGEASFFNCDVSKEDQVIQLLQHVKNTHGGLLHAAFNNAGIDGQQNDHSLSNWQRTLDVNLTGVFLCCKHEIELMKESMHRSTSITDTDTISYSIVNCSSVAGKIGLPSIPAYAASKHGVLGLTKSLAVDLARPQHGIRVNAVCPGVIATEMVEHAKAEGMDLDTLIERRQPIGRAGKPEEVAAVVVWLCSSHASMVTGCAIDVDGGWIAG